MRSQRYTIALMSVLLLLLAACAAPAQLAPRAEPVEGRVIGTCAIIDQVLVTEGASPGAYTIIIDGHLPDGCTDLYTVEHAIEGERITVTVRTSRDPEAMCTMALVPFGYTFSLDLTGLPPASYVVDVHGVTAPLELGQGDRPQNSGQQDYGALVESVRLVPGVTAAAPWAIEIRGYFRDGCTSLGQVEQAVERDRIVVSLATLRPRDAICTLALVPFEHTLALDVAGLPPGDYVIDVHGVTMPFTLSEESAAPPAPDRRAIRRDVIVGQASVEQLDVLILESHPVQINIVLQGHLADGCTRLGEISQAVHGNRIQVVVYTERPRDAICTMALVPFRETVRLDTRGLTPGVYTIEVHGLTSELRVDAGMLGAP